MLALWMFGTELERMWGTRVLLRYYFVTGIAAAITTSWCRCCRFAVTRPDVRHASTIGASGAIYGLLLAYGLTFRTGRSTCIFVFPIPAKYFVMIMGAHRVALVDRRQRRRRRAHHASRRARRRLRPAARPALQSRRRSALPLPALEDGSGEEEVRGLLRRPKKDWDKHVH